MSNHLDLLHGGVQWTILKPDSPNRMTNGLISQLMRIQQELVETYDTEAPQVKYHVFTSDIPDIFSLGGDLEYFCRCAKDGDRESLRRYAYNSVELVYRSFTNYDLPITTISLVKGAALGGGFEAALATNHLIAERQSTFSFPETRFGLFPGMGAWTFLRQRVPSKLAEDIIYSSKTYTAEELYELKVIDEICDEGQGYKTAMQFIQRSSQRHQGIHALRRMVQRYSKVDKQELYDIVSHWVDSVMALDARQLRLIEALSQTSFQRFRTG